MKISFIGFGNMARAIARGLHQNPSLHLFAAAPSLPTGVDAHGVHTQTDNALIIEGADVVILAVKPDKVKSIIAEISPVLSRKSIILSIAAGISLAKLSQYCEEGQPIIRAMPNTPIAVKKGATALIANSYVSEEQKKQVEELFQGLSLTAWVTNETTMNTITALSGSGPAYVFLFIEALISAAKALGLDPVTAESFTLQTVSGALALLETTRLSACNLRKKVTSPAGTTAAAIAILQQRGFEELIASAINAAFQRAEQIDQTIE